jgi:alkaline phosphatase
MLNRRNFFARTALVSAGTLGFPNLAKSSTQLLAAKGQMPERIIHMVADGMSWGTLTCADYLSQHVRHRSLAWMELFRQATARQAMMNMRSLNSMVTDSSAASSSWGSGSRVKNGVLNQLPNGTKLRTLYELFAQAGWKRGLVTTTEITHATPAGFAACMDSRDSAELIATQYLTRRIDLLLGGGRKFFDAPQRKDKRDLKADFGAAGYEVLEETSQLAKASVAWPCLGIFSESHLPFSLDQMASPESQRRVPSLLVMTGRALQWLGRHDHFILQVEGGRVDHAAHNCDAAAALQEMMAFDEALAEVLAFQRHHPNTLVVVTTDHGNGNMGVNGAGNAYGDSSPMFQRVAEVRASFVEILRRLREKPKVAGPNGQAPLNPQADDASGATVAEKNKKQEQKNYVPTIKQIQEIIAETTGYKVSDRRANLFQTYLAKEGTSLYELMNSDVVQLGQLLANHLAIGWAGNVHTADYVPLTAIGPGAELFEGFLQNVDVFRHYTRLARINYRNPEHPLLATGPEPSQVEQTQEYILA